MAFTVEIPQELEPTLRETAARAGVDAADYVLDSVRARLIAQAEVPACLPQGEADLLLRINRGLSPQRWAEYHRLIEKRQAETLTTEEHGVLTAISDELETANVERLEALVELARRRGKSLTALMDDLGIRAADCG